MSFPDFTRTTLDLGAIASGPARDEAVHGLPGFAPFLRGADPVVYCGSPWTIRQAPDFMTIADANTFWRGVVATGDADTVIALDLKDAAAADDAPGLFVETLPEMGGLFDGLALDRTPVSILVHGATLPLLAGFIAATEEAGVSCAALTGTVAFRVQPGPAEMQALGDILDWTARKTPGLDIRIVCGDRSPTDASLEDALEEALLEGAILLRAAASARLDVEAISARLSFRWSVSANYFREAARQRAARLLWAEVAWREGVREPGGLALRADCRLPFPGAGVESIDALPHLMVAAMAAIGGQVRSLQIATTEPTAARAQPLLRDETGATQVIDPWGGSYHVESLTRDFADTVRPRLAETADGLSQPSLATIGVRQGPNLLEAAIEAARAGAPFSA